MCRPPKPSKSKTNKVRAVARALTSIRQGKTKSDTKPTRWRQTTLIETTEESDESILLPIEASGDSLIDKEDGCFRIALQNPNGIRLKGSADMLPIVEAIHRLDLDITAIPETKLSANGITQEILQRQLNTFVGSSMVVEASAPRITEGRSDYQPGGVMAALTGKLTGRATSTYRDPMGRFVYIKLQGNRGEGIIFIVAYRVCQKKGTKAGPTTAYTQQIGAILQEELEDAERLATEGKPIPQSNRRALDPRARLLSDLKTLITKERENGFRPILCMDANEDWSDPKTGKELKQFMLETSLVDPLYERFRDDGLTHSTYARGKQRIDFVLFDTALKTAVKRIGTLGLHEAIISDHVMIYADIDETELFQGLVNRPVRVPSREFILSQADKCKKFTDEFRSIASKRNFDTRAKRLYRRFQEEGPSTELEKLYNILDKEIQEQLLHVAKTIVRKKYGYSRSPELCYAGQMVNFWKSMYFSKRNKRRPPREAYRLADILGLSVHQECKLTRDQMRKTVADSVMALREAQYKASELRQEWIERNSQDIAKAAGEPDWRRHMEKMLRDEREREINRKLTAITKGIHQSLDWIEIPTGQWYYSHEKKEIYKYDSGVFESYAAYSPSPSLIPTHPTKFYKHHHLKVPHKDIVEAQVEEQDDFIHLTAVYCPGPIWKKVTDAKEIEQLIMERNRRHLLQAEVEDGRCQEMIMQELRCNNGLDLLQEVLDGSISIDDATDETIAAWIRAVKQTEQEKNLPPITGKITKEQFQGAFKAVSEKTSSSPSGLHYTIWKCLAAEDDLAGWMSLMMSMPFEFGFVNDRWTNAIDVMLEKKKGIRRIHMLRIIGLLEADFNTALKILFSKKLIANAEKAGLNDEQWGSRRNRMALDPAMRNMMTFEYGRYMRITIAMFAADLTACFDRMFPGLSNITAAKYGMEENALKARGDTIYALKRAVRTGHGVSTTTYGNFDPEEPPLAGEYQGKGDVAILYAILSSIVLNAHATMYAGIALPSPIPNLEIRKRNDGYVDDVNTWAASMEWDNEAVEYVLNTLNEGAQILTNLNEVGGGSTAFHKCACILMSWTFNGKRLVIDYEREGTITLLDNKGAPSKITQLRPNEGNAGLGYMMAVDASQTDEHSNRLTKVTDICIRAQASRLSFKEARQLLNQRLLMQTKYGLHLSQFTEKQCHPMTVLINATFFPKLGLHSKMKRAIAYGPLAYGGLNLNTNIFSVQAQCATTYLVRTMRWNKVVASDILVVVNAFQLASGFESPVLENTELPIKYVGLGWIPHLRNMLRAINAGVWLERAWRPKRQRQYDRSIMETFVSDPLITPLMLELANELRLWLRVIFISELVTIDGRWIDAERLRDDSDWRATPVEGIRWPNTCHPTARHWKAFRKCLRLTFCTSMSPFGTVQNYKLDQPLGKWYPEHRYIEYHAYRLKDEILIRDELGLHRAIPASNPGFFDIQEEVFEGPIPKKAQPIQPNYSGHLQIWTHKSRTLVRRRQQNKPIIRLENSLNGEIDYDRLDLITDAAVHVTRKKSAIAWQVLGPEPDLRKSRNAMPLQMKDVSYSYREELLGIYHGLKDTLCRFTKVIAITCHCDCEAAIEKIKQPLVYPGQFLSADMEIVMAIQALVNKSDTKVSFNHVEGHPEKRKRKEDFTLIEMANFECDRDAELCIDGQEAPLEYSPLKGSLCVVRIGKEWLSNRPDYPIQQAFALPELKEYISQRLKISDELVEAIDTNSIGTVRATQEWHILARTSKLLFNWLPVGHNWKRYTDMDTDTCPCCGSPDETFHHLLECPNEQLVQLRSEQIGIIKRTALEQGLPPTVVHHIINILQTACNIGTYNLPTQPSIKKAWDLQERIGFKNMAIGWMCSEWTRAFQAAGAVDPDGYVQHNY